MPKKITPTRANLLKTKSKLAFSNKGYSLLDKKRTVLIQEIMNLLEEAKDIEEKIESTFAEAYKALQDCTIGLGVNQVMDYTLIAPQEEEYQLRKRSIMGVDIPELVLETHEDENNPLGYTNNNPALDIAYKKFEEVKFLSYRLAEVENTAFKLSQEIKKASKSANALSKIQIPFLTDSIHKIEDDLEEKDREENFRIKKVRENNNLKKENKK